MCYTSQFFINGTELDLDPATYEPIIGQQSGSVHQLLDKTLLVQKIAGVTIMMRITGKTVSPSIAAALMALATVTGAFGVTDYDGGSYNVTVNPGSQAVKVSRMNGVQAWEYALEFVHV